MVSSCYELTAIEFGMLNESREKKTIQRKHYPSKGLYEWNKYSFPLYLTLSNTIRKSRNERIDNIRRHVGPLK